MWPRKLDLTRNECRAKLRNIELEAYGAVMDALRAQGNLSDHKIRILQDLRAIFNISEDRHKAEARRVANDEYLGTISASIVGYETNRDWMREGRRAVPILPRGIAETALIKVANSMSCRMAAHNRKMPPPETTERDRSKTEGVPFYEERKREVVATEPMQIPIAVPLSPEESGWSRKRHANDNFALNQQLYPNVTKAQMAGRRGGKRPRKEKKQKPPPPPIFQKVDFEESINQLQEQIQQQQQQQPTLQPPAPPTALHNQGFNRIIHSYASNPIHAEIPHRQPHLVPPQAQLIQQETPLSTNHTIKEPKVQILSNEPVKIIPTLALKTLQAKGNVKLVQSPPGKVVLRPLGDPDSSRLVTQIKGLPATVAGAKLNVQYMQGANTKSNVVIVNKNEAPPKSLVQIVNTNGDAATSTKPTIVRNISSAASMTSPRPNFIKLDPAQLKCLRIVSVPTSSAVGGNVLAQKSPLTPIKLAKDTKMYQVGYTHNNGAPAQMSIETKSVPTRLPQQELSNIALQGEQMQSKLVLESNHVPVTKMAKSPHVLSYDDIIEEDSGDDTDKTKSQDEEQSDVEISFETDGSKAFFRKHLGIEQQQQDKLSELARGVLED